jgi:hypothetical protein
MVVAAFDPFLPLAGAAAQDPLKTIAYCDYAALIIDVNGTGCEPPQARQYAPEVRVRFWESLSV